MLKISKKKSLLLGVIALFAIINFVIVLKASAPKGESIFEEPKREVKEIVTEPPLPPGYIISMPYTPQAPFANWAVHEESCEEAAILMYHHFLLGEGAGQLNQIQADKDLKALRAWQIANWGPEKDLDLTEVGRLAKEYWGYGYKVTEGVTSETIKRELVNGRPVLVPVMTHSLQNPHYGREDTYHILVIKGYDTAGVITNDAGIREGMDYKYTWEVLWQAIDAQSKKMNQGRDILTITK
jgi:hypothetical protein